MIERRIALKSVIEKWKGTFSYSGTMHNNLKEWKPKNGEKFEIKLYAPRRTDRKGDNKC